MKYCKFCGNEIADDGICTCAESQAQGNVSSGNPTETSSTGASIGQNKSLLIGAGAILAVIVIVIVLISSMFSGGYQKPIDNFVKGFNKCNAKTMMKAFPEDMMDKDDKVTDKDLETLIGTLEMFYGDDIKISYDIEGKAKLDKDEIEDLEDELDVKISKAYEVDVNLEISGDDEEEEDVTSFVVAKIKGEGWKLVSDGMSSIF